VHETAIPIQSAECAFGHVLGRNLGEHRFLFCKERGNGTPNDLAVVATILFVVSPFIAAGALFGRVGVDFVISLLIMISLFLLMPTVQSF
jgi:hypothetical protein